MSHVAPATPTRRARRSHSYSLRPGLTKGIIWALENPNEGIVEADEMDFQRNLEICMPYLGPVVGKYSDWTPLQGRGELFPEELDKSDPWQFKNFRVV